MTPDQNWIGLANQLGTLQGAKIMVALTLLIQVVMWLFRGKLGDKTGQYKFWIVATLSLISAVLIELLRDPVITMQAVYRTIASAPVIMSAQVLLNQFGKQNLTDTGKEIK